VLDQEVVGQLLAVVDHALIGTDVDRRVERGVGLARMDRGGGGIDGGDEALGLLAVELAERQDVAVEGEVIGDQREALGELGLERDRAGLVVGEIERLLHVAAAEDLHAEPDIEAANMRELEQMLRGGLPLRVMCGLHDVVERGPLDVVAAVLDDPVERAARELVVGRLPHPEVRLDRMQRVELQAALPPDLGFVQHAELGGAGIKRRWIRNQRRGRRAKPEAEVLERVCDAVLRTEHIAGVDDPLRFAAGLDPVTLATRLVDDDLDREAIAGASVLHVVA